MWTVRVRTILRVGKRYVDGKGMKRRGYEDPEDCKRRA